MTHIDGVPLTEIEDTAVIPLPNFIESVRNFGIIQPIILRRRRAIGTQYTIVDGRRRVATMRLLERRDIPALVISERSNAVARAMTLVANTHRSANPRAEFLAIENLVGQGHSLPQIAERLHLPIRRVERRYALSALSSQLLVLYRTGQLNHATATQALHLTLEQQQSLAERIVRGETFTSAQLAQMYAQRLVQESQQQRMLEFTESGLDEPPRPPTRYVGSSPEYVQELEQRCARLEEEARRHVRAVNEHGSLTIQPLTTSVREAQTAVQRYMVTRVHYPEGTNIRGRLSRNLQTRELEFDLAVIVARRDTDEYQRMMQAVRRISQPGRQVIRERVLATLGAVPVMEWNGVVTNLRSAIAAIPMEHEHADAAYHHVLHAYLELARLTGIVVEQ